MCLIHLNGNISLYFSTISSKNYLFFYFPVLVRSLQKYNEHALLTDFLKAYSIACTCYHDIRSINANHKQMCGDEKKRKKGKKRTVHRLNGMTSKKQNIASIGFTPWIGVRY